MNKTNKRCGILVIVVCGFLASGVAFASTSHALPKSAKATSHSSSGSTSCLSPLILASGGLCCPGPRNSLSPCISSTLSVIDSAGKKLPPLVVNGVNIPLPVALQLIKRGLQRSWSAKLADSGLLVCVYNKRPGTRVPLLHCETNSEYFHGSIEADSHIKSSALKVHCYYHCFLTEENILVALVRYVDHDESRAIALGSLLGKAPSARSTYSLRMPETVPLWFPAQHVIANYPAYVTFVVGNGELADVEMVRRHKTRITMKSDAKLRKRKQRENLSKPVPPGYICTNTSVTC